MFERYTIQARQAIFFARDEAGKLGSPYLETEHLLLGLAIADQALLSPLLATGASEQSIRDQIVAQSPIFESVPHNRDIPLSNEVKRVLELAHQEAKLPSASGEIGTRNLLIGLLLETDSFGARMLRERGADLETSRTELAANPLHQTPTPQGNASFSPSALANHVQRTEEPARSGSFRHTAESESSGSLFARYTEKSLRCIFYARYFVSEIGGNMLEPEHLLLGIIRETHPGFIDFEETRTEIRDASKESTKVATSVDVPIADAAKRVLQFASEEVGVLQADSITPGHLILGILAGAESRATKALAKRGITPESVRKNLKEGNDWSAPLT